MMRFSPPVPISAQLDVGAFSCGDPALDGWLRERAGDAETRTAKTFVLLTDKRVIGFYTVAVGSVLLPMIDSDLPNPVPAMILGLLAVDQAYQRQGLGAALLYDALLRILNVRRGLDIRLVVAWPITQPLRRFFTHYGFETIPTLPHAHFLPIDTLIKAASGGAENRRAPRNTGLD
ncbi:GNAT family N-acetyltransferase [Elstera litoralis]|uniref:GNAT family N-acetyltransferase n=1 Tax=Elstera litoralis TaxID=552518 RepID=UPI000696295D|nr:GNAT family N-acetyltransferase [Elstera litoralis]